MDNRWQGVVFILYKDFIRSGEGVWKERTFNCYHYVCVQVTEYENVNSTQVGLEKTNTRDKVNMLKRHGSENVMAMPQDYMTLCLEKTTWRSIIIWVNIRKPSFKTTIEWFWKTQHQWNVSKPNESKKYTKCKHQKQQVTCYNEWLKNKSHKPLSHNCSGNMTL